VPAGDGGAAGKARRAGPFAEEGAEVDRKRPVLTQADLRQHRGIWSRSPGA